MRRVFLPIVLGAVAAIPMSGCAAVRPGSSDHTQSAQAPSLGANDSPVGPATREGFGVPYPSLAAARAAVDSLQSGLIIVVDTIVLMDGEPTPAPDEVARVRLVRNHHRCGPSARSISCASIIWVETKRPQWMPR